MRLLLSFIFCIVVIVSSSFAQEAKELKRLLVNSKDIHCVYENKEKYQAHKRDLIIIYLDDCPNNDPSVALKKVTKNIAVGVGSDKLSASIERIITYTKKQLSCLKLEGEPDNNRPYITIPENPCLEGADHE